MPASRSTTAVEGPAAAPPRYRHDRYTLVCGLIIATVLSTAVLGDGAPGLLLTLALMSATLTVTLRTSDAGRRALRIGVVVSALVTVGIAVALFTGNQEPARVAYGLAMMVLVGVTPVVIARRLMQHQIVTRNTVAGAAAIYLLIGLLFAVVYSLLGWAEGLLTGTVGTGAFFVASRPIEPSDYVYYSFTSLSTVGYGDLTAAAAIGRMLSVCEALLGQLYLVTVVAVLVSNIGRGRRRPADGPVMSLPNDD